MRIRVDSKRRDAGEVRRLVRLACRELDADTRRRLYVEVADSRKHVSGTASDLRVHALWDAEWKRIPRGSRYRIRVAIPPDGSWPIRQVEHGIEVLLFDWREALVWIMGHEAKHIDHFSIGRVGRGANGYRGEEAADAFAEYVLDGYREERSRHDP